MSRPADRFGPVFAELLAEPRVMGLKFGPPNGVAEALLKAATVERAFSGLRVHDRDMAAAALAGVWLYHDFFEESHDISQAIATPTGSYWHAILHRREPDYSNARYWFRRVGRHPVFSLLHTESHGIGAGSEWDPIKFIDACERVAGTPGDLEKICRDAQMKEWWALFNFSYHKAIGRVG